MTTKIMPERARRWLAASENVCWCEACQFARAYLDLTAENERLKDELAVAREKLEKVEN